jgi:PAS domain S-box-containing protein
MPKEAPYPLRLESDQENAIKSVCEATRLSKALIIRMAIDVGLINIDWEKFKKKTFLHSKSLPESNRSLHNDRIVLYSVPAFPDWMQKERYFIIVTDANGHTLFINDAFQQVCGYSPDDLAGRKPGDVLQGRETDSRMKKKLHKAVHSGESLSLRGLLNCHKDGSHYSVDLHMEPVKDERNRIHYFVAVERLHDSRSYGELRQIAARIREELKAIVNSEQPRHSEAKRNRNPIPNSKQPSSATELLGVAENTEPKNVPKRKPKP